MMPRHCTFCGEPVDPLSPYTWRRVIGWERKAQAQSRKSGSDIALREARDEYACDPCVSRAKQGLPTGQEALI